MPVGRLGRPGRRAALAAATLLALLFVLGAGAGWYYSSVLKSGALLPDYSPEKLDFRILRLDAGEITLVPDGGDADNLRADGIWGLQGENGYGHALDVMHIEGDEVTRRYKGLRGTLREGDRVRLDSFAFDGDPRSARGIAYRDVVVPSVLGDLPAWKVDGSTGRG